jgi:hypothetical protein
MIPLTQPFSDFQPYIRSMKATQRNVLFIKSETGKIRLAVASDTATYVKMKWLSSFSGTMYKKWEWGTLAESRDEMAMRLEIMVRALENGCFGLPYDFAAYETQPTTRELQILLSIVYKSGRRGVPDALLAEYDAIVADVISSFDNARLLWTDFDSVAHDIPVTGGLMSGLSVTSEVGNGYNEVLAQNMIKILTFLIGRSRAADILIWLRGDDTAYASRFVQVLQYIFAVYKSQNIIAGVGKFGLTRMLEFLRVSYSKDRVYGYPIRSIPGLSQMKPSSNSPRYPLSVIGAVQEAANVITRRLDDVDVTRRVTALVVHFASRVLASLSLPLAMISIPVSYGGLGLTFSNRLARLHPHLPTFAFSGKVEISEWAVDRMDAQLKKYDIHNDPTQLASDYVNNLVVTDDVPKLTVADRSAWRTQVRKQKFQVIPVTTFDNIFVMRVAVALKTMLPALIHLKAFERMCRDGQGTYESYASMVSVVSSVKPLLIGTGVSLKSYLKVHYPPFYQAVQNMVRRGWTMSDAMDWLFGTVVVTVGDLHPEMISVIKLATVYSVNLVRFKGPVHAVATVASHHYAEQFKQSPYYLKFWRW